MYPVNPFRFPLAFSVIVAIEVYNESNHGAAIGESLRVLNDAHNARTTSDAMACFDRATALVGEL